MINRALILLVLFVPFLLASCSPRPVFRMSPEAENTTFNQGTEYVHFNEGGIEMTISYYRHLNERFVMDVEIVNQTDSVFRVDPRQFSYQAFGNMNGNYSKTDEVIAARKAIDPEIELLRKDMAIAKSVANQKTGTLLYAIGQTASIVHYAMEDDPEKREEISEQSQESAVNHQINQHNRKLHRRGLRDQREIWEIDAIRKTDLFPGEYIRGYIFFKNEADARAYFIQYKPKKAIFRVLFRQFKYGDNHPIKNQ